MRFAYVIVAGIGLGALIGVVVLWWEIEHADERLINF